MNDQKKTLHEKLVVFLLAFVMIYIYLKIVFLD